MTTSIWPFFNNGVTAHAYIPREICLRWKMTRVSLSMERTSWWPPWIFYQMQRLRWHRANQFVVLYILSIDGGVMSVKIWGTCSMSNCGGSSIVFPRRKPMATLILQIFSTKNVAKPFDRWVQSLSDLTWRVVCGFQDRRLMSACQGLQRTFRITPNYNRFQSAYRWSHSTVSRLRLTFRFFSLFESFTTRIQTRHKNFLCKY